jgi:hypothetical protein
MGTRVGCHAVYSLANNCSTTLRYVRFEITFLFNYTTVLPQTLIRVHLVTNYTYDTYVVSFILYLSCS